MVDDDVDRVIGQQTEPLLSLGAFPFSVRPF